jgi:hypothetical protein
MTGRCLPVSVCDQSRKRVRVNERIDLFPIFDAIGRWDVHLAEVMSDK